MKRFLVLLLSVVLILESSAVCTATAAPAVKEPPIIFIPGVMGTNLYNSSKSFNLLTKVWTPDSINLLTMGNQIKMGKKLYTRPIENQNAKGVTREYGALNVYKTMIDRLCKEFPNREIYFFSYDFRQDNTETAKLLNDFIEQQGFPSVDIVCHSMGGLITSSYVSQFENKKADQDKKINKVITFGTPYEGLTRTFSGVLTKDVLANDMEKNMYVLKSFGDAFLCLGGLKRSVKAEMPAIAQLAPTKAYVQESGFFYRQTGTERYGFLNLSTRPVYSEIDYSGYKQISDLVFGKNYAKAETFHESILEDSMNVLAKMDNSYFVVGTGQFTIASAKFNDGKKLSKLEVDEFIYEQNGDGTVPYLSGSMVKKLEKINNSSERFKKFEADHNGVVGYDPLNHFSGDEKALNWLVDTLKTGTSKIASDTINPVNYVTLRLTAGTEIEIVSEEGELLSSVSDNLTDSATFGRLDYIGEDNDIIVCLKDTQDYTINIYGEKDDDTDILIQQFDKQGELIDDEEINELTIEEDGTVDTEIDSKSIDNINIHTLDSLTVD